MYFIKTDVFSRKFNEVNSKSKLFCALKDSPKIKIKLKNLHAIA